MASLMNLDKLPGEVRGKIAGYADALLKLYGDDVSSIFIYGSATGRNFVPGVSDINISLVFSRLDFSTLKKALKIVSHGISKKIAAPLFLTETHIKTSLDVFPMEFLDMKENHVTIFGEELLRTLEINTRNLRLVCEEQIKGKLIRIRQAYLEIGLKKRGVEALLKESLRSLLNVFRNLIRLKGKVPDRDNVVMLTQLCMEFGLADELFLTIYRDKSNDEKIGSQDVEVYLDRYINELQKLARIIDGL